MRPVASFRLCDRIGAPSIELRVPNVAGSAVMQVLSDGQVEAFHRDGYVMMEDAVSPGDLAALREVFADWVTESRSQSGPWGTTQDGRARFDVEPGHCAESPALRRVASPVEVSEVYLDVMRNAPLVDAAAQLVGPNIEFNNAKVNSKQPGAATAVRFHQDFLYEPHTNDDLVAALVFLDDVTPRNGPLEVVPGSHRGPLREHWHDGVFTGTVAPDVLEHAAEQAVACHGPAGSACLLHTRTIHGSGPNLSDSSRTLYICTYRSEDSQPLQTNHIPSIFDGEVVRGVATNRVRCSASEMEFPEIPTGASFFEQQAQHPVA